LNGRIPKLFLAVLLAAASAVLPGGCGGNGNETTGILTGFEDSGPAQTQTFWAYNFVTGTDYQVTADKVGTGTRCYVYLEQGRTVAQAVIDSLIAEFDANIHPAVTTAFGEPPNPGIDGDRKIYILLLDIRDTYDPVTYPAYVAGYFDPFNERLQVSLPSGSHSNEKEMFYMDIAPGTPGSARFLGTLAHEFQHMIHYNAEVTVKNASDNLWLNEAMSTIAPLYCGYEPDYMRVGLFQAAPMDSLTIWNGTVFDYGVVYMWAQYVKDRIDTSSGATVFRRMLQDTGTGISSVEAALSAIGYGKDFVGVFRDWAVANYSGNALSWSGHPEWSYTTINTWPGVYPIGDGVSIELDGMFGYVDWTNVTSLHGLGPWSVDYYLYTPLSGGTGSVTWTRGASNAFGRASLGDNATLVPDMVSGTPYAYTGAGYLVDINPTGNDYTASGDSVAYASLMPGTATAREILEATGRDPAVRRLVAMTGRPFPVCVHPFFQEKVRRLNAQETGRPH
jgi:hypothetical protein